MNYTETINFLYGQLPVFHRIGKAAYKADLNNTLALDEYFGHPHFRFRSVHVAGTNGKGSVSHMLASALQEAGYKTGLYTSPHLKDYRERIRINGKMVPEEKIISFVENNMSLINTIKPSFFELSVALAFEYFGEEKVDIAVIETGLGGRLDSTNIITPLLSIITNIGYDHMDLLGNTLEKIAYEKAGIIKKDVPVIIGEISNETKPVFLKKAEELTSAIGFAEELFECKLEDPDPVSGSRSYYLIDLRSGKTMMGKTPLGGDYQAQNIAVVASAFEYLTGPLKLSQQNLKDGINNVIKNTGLMGRWQIIGNDPLTICDTGHNEHGLVYVLGQINKTQKACLHMVIGFVNDKNLDLVLPLFPKDAKYYFARASVPRALDELTLKLKASQYGLNGDAYGDVPSAIKAARLKAEPDDLIFIGGSTFVVADAL
jgi:dihydrofolate synthase / folylpolyglutamate synthase